MIHTWFKTVLELPARAETVVNFALRYHSNNSYSNNSSKHTNSNNSRNNVCIYIYIYTLLLLHSQYKVPVGLRPISSEGLTQAQS